ncbi:Folylpolyglutamate synthase [Colletotrichum fructicola Nara gc5]|uniref:Folylpolyglutamate synthase n=1 Tax=Colletotrichum fructicola (strain Nara gc5) TaxID=1213859 RepID=A0A7J6IP36_COLFN|nr:Folylpolyglutamate synthase [Colletotrichum fructicola Nara gc5]
MPAVREDTRRTYEDAINLLNSTQSGHKALEERRRHGQKLDGGALKQMEYWLRCLSYAPRDLNRMNIVHVAGTKGKGTTCAYTNSILQSFHNESSAPRKIGLYTSPHLVSVRERIRINSEPISEELFTQYFFEVWDALSAKQELGCGEKPTYFRFLTLMSFHVFMREYVNAAIYEVGVGGELDSTNVIDQPVAVAITTLGIDHVQTLATRNSSLPCALIFNQQSTRDAHALLKVVHESMYKTNKTRFRYVLFCTNVTFKTRQSKSDLANFNVNPADLKTLQAQKEMAETWRRLDPVARVLVVPTIEDSADFMQNIGCAGTEMNVLVTGSFYLVGGLLSLLENTVS